MTIDDRMVSRITAEVLAERQRQDEKWGPQDHPLTFPGSYRTPEYWAAEAEQWRQTNAQRVEVRTVQGFGPSENCAWDGIHAEEFCEAFGAELPGLQYAEFVQAAAVNRKILELLNERALEHTGHMAGCPALDVHWTLTAPEACDCDGSRITPANVGEVQRMLAKEDA